MAPEPDIAPELGMAAWAGPPSAFTTPASLAS